MNSPFQRRGRLASRPIHAQAATTLPRVPALFAHFVLYKVEPGWRRLPARTRNRGLAQFAQAFERLPANLQYRVFLTTGLREDVDLLLWLYGPGVPALQDFLVHLSKLQFGRYLHVTHAWLAATRESQYTKLHVVAFDKPFPARRFLIVYPFVKSREWYLLPFGERRRMMEQHAHVGRQFPQVRLNTLYSFGLDDQDFVVAFETDDLHAFQDLVMKLRELEVSRYTVRDTPMVVGVAKPLREVLASVGG
jgi:chlorite dismutase